jgi:hypothetical protein
VTNDGLVEIGNYTSDSWLSIAASSTGRSQINFATGVDPSAPNSGDLWWNGTALNFYDGSTTSNLLNVSKFTDAGTVTYLTATTDDFALGGSTLASSVFSVDVSAGDIFLGSSGTVDPSLVFENSSSQLANLDFTSTGNFNLTNAGLNVRLGINKAAPAEELDVVGDIQLTGDLLTDTVVTYGSGYQWTNTIGGTGSDNPLDIAVDKANNVYVAGQFSGTVDFNPGVGTDNRVSAGGTDIFVTKYSSGNTYQWTNTIGSTGTDQAVGIIVDNSGNVYVTGAFTGTVDFNPGTGTDNKTSSGGTDIFLTKYNSEGSYIWTITTGGTLDDRGSDLALDRFGNIYAVGYFEGTVDFNPGSGTDNRVSNGLQDVYVAKYDINGNYQWANTFGGTGDERGDGIAVDSLGNIYATGGFQNTVDFNPGSAIDNKVSAGSYDIYTTKYSQSGDYKWTNIAGAANSDRALDITVDPLGNVYTAGEFQSTVDFDPSGGTDSRVSAGGSDGFLTSYSESGGYRWTNLVSSSSNNRVNGVATDSLSNVYIAGSFGGTVDFDPGAGTDNETASGFNTNSFTSKYTSDGNYFWTNSVGGTAGVSGTKLVIDENNYAYATGTFSGTTDFDHTSGTDSRANSGGTDIFTTKYGPDSYLGSDIGTSVDPFANVYTYGLLAKGAATFEDVINVSGNILAAAPTLTTGYITAVESTGNKGLLTDIAINNQGYPVIVHRDTTAAPERVRTSVCSTPDCSGSVTSTSHDDPGHYTGNFANAVAIRPDNRPIFQFFNGTINGGDPRIGDCTNSTCTASNIREANNNVQIVGRYADIIIRTNGLPLGVSHRNDGDNTQVYACADINCTTLATLYTHDGALPGTKQNISVIERGNGIPFIVLYDATGADLRYINCSDGPCSTAVVGTLVTANDVGQWNRLALTKEGYPIVAYRNTTNQSVELVICKDFACGNFEQRVLVDTADNLGDLQLGLATKVDGSPVVSYYNTTNTSLYLYECHDPNCKTGTNHRLTNTDNRGQYSSIARKMGTNDEFTIAYYNATAGDLEVYNFAKSMSGGVSLGTASNYFKDLFVGKINTKLASISGFDVAEEYLVEDESIEAGEVVRFTGGSSTGTGPAVTSTTSSQTTTSAAVSTSNNSDAKLLIEKSQGAYDEGLIGVVSTEPGLYLSNWDKSEAEKKKTRPVALVGRVPVKVSSENGAIKRGDLLTSSAKYPGYAMKATRGGYVVGRSMEDFGLETDDTAANVSGSQQTTDETITMPRLTTLEIQELEKLREFAIAENQSSMAAALELRINELKQLLAAEDTQASPEAKLGKVTMYVDLGYVPDQYYDALAKGRNSEDNQAGLNNALSGLGLEAQYLPEGSGSYFGGALQFVGKKGKLTLEDITVTGGLRVESDLIVKGVLTGGNLSTETLVIKSDLTLENFTGVAEILPGETETIVKMPDITEKSAVFVTSNGAETWVERIMPGEGFVIKIDEAREEILRVNFAIINR